MPNCSVAVEIDKLPSEKLWYGDVPSGRLPVLIIGCTFTLLTLALYGLLIHRHSTRGRRMTENQAGAHFFPAKLAYQERMLYMGPLMVITFLVQMCAPELATMAELFQNTYKAMAYYFLMRFTGFQFGLPHNAFRDDESGTLQQHKPSKIWNKPPCCCVWVFFLSFMKERIMTAWDGRLVYRLTTQYCVLGPLTSVIKMIVFYEGVSKANTSSVGFVCDIVGIMSLLCAVYANKVYSTIAEEVPPIHHQLKQREWFNHGKDLGKDTTAPSKNISVKNGWITIATVVPVLAGIIVGLVVKDDLCLDNGDVLLVQDLRNYMIGFIAILVQFLAGVFAFTKAFPVPAPGNRSENLEFLAMSYLQMELWPAFALEYIPSSINGIVEGRRSKGKDPDLGVPSQMFLETFGECMEPRLEPFHAALAHPTLTVAAPEPVPVGVVGL